MTIIANPIYDSVFKFLMEDERAAKVTSFRFTEKRGTRVENVPQ